MVDGGDDVTLSDEERKALSDAARTLREIRRLPLDISQVSTTLEELSQEPTKAATDQKLQIQVLAMARDAEEFLASKHLGDKQLSGATAKPAYQSKVFRCLGDYDKCRANRSATLCSALCIICIAQQLIPFAPKG
jgi:hypothetical protein